MGHITHSSRERLPPPTREKRGPRPLSPSEGRPCLLSAPGPLRVPPRTQGQGRLVASRVPFFRLKRSPVRGGGPTRWALHLRPEEYVTVDPDQDPSEVISWTDPRFPLARGHSRTRETRITRTQSRFADPPFVDRTRWEQRPRSHLDPPLRGASRNGRPGGRSSRAFCFCPREAEFWCGRTPQTGPSVGGWRETRLPSLHRVR